MEPVLRLTREHLDNSTRGRGPHRVYGFGRREEFRLPKEIIRIQAPLANENVNYIQNKDDLHTTKSDENDKGCNFTKQISVDTGNRPAGKLKLYPYKTVHERKKCKEVLYPWLVVLASFLAYFMLAGTRSITGLLQVELEIMTGESTQAVSWIGAMINSLSLLTAPLVSAATKIVSCRALSCLGGIMCFVGFTGTYFIQSAPMIFICTGLLPGIGFGLVTTPSTIMVSRCFNKKRTVAICLSIAGGGLGFIVFPQIFTLLLDSYGPRGAVLICAAFYTHGVLCGAIYKSEKPLHGGVKAMKEVLQTLFNKEVVKKHNFMPMMISILLFGMAEVIPFLYLPIKAADIRVSLTLSAMLISAIGITSLVGRIGIGIITHGSQSRRLIFYILSFSMFSFSMILIPFVDTFTFLIFSSCLFGISTGVIFSLNTVLLTDLFGPDNLPSSYGLNCLSYGIGSLLGGPIAEALLAALSDHNAPFYMAGICTMMGTVVLVNVVKRRDKTDHGEISVSVIQNILRMYSRKSSVLNLTMSQKTGAAAA